MFQFCGFGVTPLLVYPSISPNIMAKIVPRIAKIQAISDIRQFTSQ